MVSLAKLRHGFCSRLMNRGAIAMPQLSTTAATASDQLATTLNAQLFYLDMRLTALIHAVALRQLQSTSVRN
jgi:hypothetical protein